jgi:enoyl-CoA hydratase/carnithine racemase
MPMGPSDAAPGRSEPERAAPAGASLVVDGAIARLTLERPRALNALNREMAAAIEDACDRLERATLVSVVIVSGRGRAFCAGNDIAEMPGLTAPEAEALSRRWQAIMDRFARLPQVTIAAIRGYALGGGCMLAIAQDLRIAEAGARLGLPEITLGFNPSYGIARLLDVVGGAHARELLLTGRRLDAAEAMRIGLVTRVVPDGALDASAAELAAEIARHPRAGLAATKAVVAGIRAGHPGAEAQAYAAALRSDPEARARIAAFVARSPRGA